MAGNDNEETPATEKIPTLTWVGLPYRVQILDNMVLLYHVKYREQYARTAREEAIRHLRTYKSARIVTAVLRDIFGSAVISSTLTPNERAAVEAFELVLKKTGDLQKADDAYAVTMELSQ
jgi:hypothetical protein